LGGRNKYGIFLDFAALLARAMWMNCAWNSAARQPQGCALKRKTVNNFFRWIWEDAAVSIWEIFGCIMRAE
jgi:hypothetical protein